VSFAADGCSGFPPAVFCGRSLLEASDGSEAVSVRVIFGWYSRTLGLRENSFQAIVRRPFGEFDLRIGGKIVAKANEVGAHADRGSPNVRPN